MPAAHRNRAEHRPLPHYPRGVGARGRGLGEVRVSEFIFLCLQRFLNAPLYTAYPMPPFDGGRGNIGVPPLITTKLPKAKYTALTGIKLSQINYFNGRATDVTSAQAIKSIRDKAYDAAKLDVIKNR